jgi:hypothetical protein
MTHELRTLDPAEIDAVSGGFVCGGLCVAGAFALGAAIGFFGTRAILN